MNFSVLELVVVACGLALLGWGLLSLRAPARRNRQPLPLPAALAPISRDEILAIQREAEEAAQRCLDSGFATLTPNPYPVGTRARIIWETTFHSVTMD